MKNLLLAGVAAIALIAPTATAASAMSHARWVAMNNARFNGWNRPVMVNPYMYGAFPRTSYVVPVYRPYHHVHVW
jgi:hypothetical protein